ncbi:MAG: hypothetical protein ACHRXM_16670 [Isosphaerales bacterium]
MIQLRNLWLSLGGPASPLGSQVTPPAWAKSISPDNTSDQQSTTGGNNGQVIYFQHGLIYWRDRLVGPDGSSAPIVMLYDTPTMGFDTSARFRLQLLDQFADANGLVIVNYDLGAYKTNTGKPDLDAGIPIADNPFVDTNDSAWMTGQALAAVAMANDMTSAALILRGMLNFEWSSSGDLLRYTGNTKRFSGLDPSTQIAGCHIAWKFAQSAGNSVVQDLARGVIGKWVDELFRCNGTLGPSGPKMLVPGLIALHQVANRMGLDQTRLDHLTLLLNEQKVAVAVVSFGVLSTLAVLDDPTLYALCLATEAGLDQASLGIPKWLAIKLGIQSPTATTPLDTSGLNLMFWEDLVMHDYAPTALLNVVTTSLATLTSSYKMMPFQWLAGAPSGVAACEAFLTDWSAANGDAGSQTPSQGDYLWRTDKRDGPGNDTYNRVDYLVLRGLFNLDPSGWQNAPDHFGVSFDLPIPQLGSVHFSGSINSNGAFSLAGSETLAPFGFKLESADFTFDSAGISVRADLQLLNWNVAHVSGALDLLGGFSLGTSISLSALGGPLASVLSGQVQLLLDAGGVTLDGSLGIPAIGGSFHVHASIHSDGRIDIAGIPASFTNFPAREAARLWHGVGAAVSQIAGALTHAGHTLGEAADALMKGANADLNATAQAFQSIGRKAADVADALKSLSGGTPGHALIRAALESAHYAGDEVSQAMKHAYAEIPHQDVAPVPAVNTWLIPHVDTPAGPHVNIWAIPHVDSPAGPHVNVWAIPHVDAHGPHSDVGHSDGHPLHVDHSAFHHHGDAPGPHVDTPHIDAFVPPHIDTPHQHHTDGPVPPHVDRPHQNHTDGPFPPHGDTPHQNHLDTPPQGRIDLP